MGLNQVTTPTGAIGGPNILSGVSGPVGSSAEHIQSMQVVGNYAQAKLPFSKRAKDLLELDLNHKAYLKELDISLGKYAIDSDSFTADKDRSHNAWVSQAQMDRAYRLDSENIDLKQKRLNQDIKTEDLYTESALPYLDAKAKMEKLKLLDAMARRQKYLFGESNALQSIASSGQAPDTFYDAMGNDYRNRDAVDEGLTKIIEANKELIKSSDTVGSLSTIEGFNNTFRRIEGKTGKQMFSLMSQMVLDLREGRKADLSFIKGMSPQELAILKANMDTIAEVTGANEGDKEIDKEFGDIVTQSGLKNNVDIWSLIRNHPELEGDLREGDLINFIAKRMKGFAEGTLSPKEMQMMQVFKECPATVKLWEKEISRTFSEILDTAVMGRNRTNLEGEDYQKLQRNLTELSQEAYRKKSRDRYKSSTNEYGRLDPEKYREGNISEYMENATVMEEIKKELGGNFPSDPILDYMRGNRGNDYTGLGTDNQQYIFPQVEGSKFTSFENPVIEAEASMDKYFEDWDDEDFESEVL